MELLKRKSQNRRTGQLCRSTNRRPAGYGTGGFTQPKQLLAVHKWIMWFINIAASFLLKYDFARNIILLVRWNY